MLERRKRSDEIARWHLDSTEQWGAYVCSKGSRPLPDYWIHADLQRLSGLMHNVGYVPCTRFVLHVVEEEELVFQVCHHSEKLAIALGLINIAPSSPLWIIKICGFFKIATLPRSSPQKYWGMSESLWSLWRWYLLVHGLLVMPVVCLVNHCVKFILFWVACLVVWCLYGE
jgi:hypothetical protein